MVIFDQIQKAYDLLTDEAQRATYDAKLAAKAAVKARTDALDAETRAAKEKLERRENEAKRRRTDASSGHGHPVSRDDPAAVRACVALRGVALRA